MDPSGPQLAPLGMYAAAQMVSAGPPFVRTRLSSPFAQNPIHSLSGEKNGSQASSVPSRGAEELSSNARRCSIELDVSPAL